MSPADDRPAHLTEPRWVRALLLGAALAFLTLFLLVPLAGGVHRGLAQGVAAVPGRHRSRPR
ncbi:sulfate transport system permease [Bordetella pertussis]|nr:sulfate transport system permease [Bordetella pertussis]